MALRASVSLERQRAILPVSGGVVSEGLARAGSPVRSRVGPFKASQTRCSPTFLREKSGHSSPGPDCKSF